MNDKQNGDHPASGSDQNTSLPPPAQPTIKETQVASESKEITKTEQPEVTKTEFRVFEILSLGVNVVLAIIGIGALYIYSGQLSVMRGTLAEMKRSGQEFTNQVWKAIDNLNWLARSMDGSQKVSQQTFDFSQKQSKSGLDASIEISRNEQRAWVGIGAVVFYPIERRTFNPFTENEPFEQVRADITLQNTGRTPAVDVTMITRTGVNPPTKADMNKEIPVTHESLAPNAWHIEEAKSKPFDQITTGFIMGGSFHLYLSGTIRYKDVFKRPHKTTFCRVTMKQTGRVVEQQVCDLPPEFNMME